MATTTKPSSADFTSLSTDVALLKQFNEKVAEPTFKDIQQTQKEIKEALATLDHVTRKDFEEYKTQVDDRFTEVKRRNWVQNTLSAIMGALLSALITYIVLGWFK